VNKFLYGTQIPFSDKKVVIFREPKKGDIIVFKYPENPTKDFIKRVIATEGDTIEEKNKVVYVNGEPVVETYAYHYDPTTRSDSDRRDTFGQLRVPKDKIFVMGDNRDHSYDSRFWGFVDEKEVKGKAFIIYWSWDPDKWVRFNRIGRLIE